MAMSPENRAKCNKNLLRNMDLTPEQRSLMARNGGIKSGIAKREKKQRKEMLDMLFDKLYSLGGMTLAVDVAITKAQEGDIKELIELLKIVKPTEKVEPTIVNNLGIQKVYVTKEQEEEALKHIEDVIGEQ